MLAVRRDLNNIHVSLVIYLNLLLKAHMQTAPSHIQIY